MTGYAIIIEGEGDSFSAYAPELPGCIAAGSSVTEVEAMMRGAGLVDITFSPHAPFWCATGRRDT